MSEKVLGCRFRAEIDRFIHEGKSSRYISQWLAQRGTTISHVTLATYRNSIGFQSTDNFPTNSPKSHDDLAKCDESDMAQNLFQKAVENQNNPAALKIYLENYVKLADRSKMFHSEQQTSVVPDLKGDFEELRAGRPTERIKKIVYQIFAFQHPYWSEEAHMRDDMISDDYKRWKRTLVATLEPLFAGCASSYSGDR